MRNSLRTNIEFGAQIVIAIAVVVVAGIIVKRHISQDQGTALKMPSFSAGERLNLADVDWKQNKKSLVFFLNKDCRYCTSSAAVYRQLTATMLGGELFRNEELLSSINNALRIYGRQ